MKNADMPAMPAAVDLISIGDPDSDNYPQGIMSCSGLTKREHFAAMAMQGLLASDTNDEWQADKMATYAVKCADALLEELSK